MKKRDYWSASRIDCANYCRMRYYLRYIEKEKALRLSAYAKGSLLHELIEHFWERLGTEEEVEKDRKNNKKKAAEKKRYFDGETFAGFARGKWSRVCQADMRLKEKLEKGNLSEKETKK